MNITPIETIRSEAEAAAAAGKSKNDACRFPFDSPEGRKWIEFYEGAAYLYALAQYREAIRSDAA